MAVSKITLCFVLICAVCAANAQVYTQQYYLHSLNRAVEAAKAMYETLAEEQARVRYGYRCSYYAAANKQQGSEQQFRPFYPPVSQQGGGWVTDQQVLEAERDPNKPTNLHQQYAAPLADGGPGYTQGRA